MIRLGARHRAAARSAGTVLGAVASFRCLKLRTLLDVGSGGGGGGESGGGGQEAGPADCYVSWKYRLKASSSPSSYPSQKIFFPSRLSPSSLRGGRDSTELRLPSHPGLSVFGEMSGLKKPRTVSRSSKASVAERPRFKAVIPSAGC